MNKLIELILESKKDINNIKYNLSSILLNLYSSPKALFYLYEEIPIEYRPDFKKEDMFTDSFFELLCKLDQDTFNHYFFSTNLKDVISIENVRVVSFNNTSNKKLEDYVNSMNNPKNIDEIIGLLKDLYFVNNEINNRVKETIVKYQEKLQRLNSITAPSSRAIDNLDYCLEYVASNKGFSSSVDIIEALNFDIYKVYKKTRSFKIKTDFVLKDNDMEGIDRLLNKYPKESKYEVLSTLTKFMNLPSILAKDNDSEKVYYLWKILEEHLIKYAHNEKVLDYLKKKKVNVDSGLEVLNYLHYNHDELIEKNLFKKTQMPFDMSEDIIIPLQKIILENKLNNEKPTIKRVKI